MSVKLLKFEHQLGEIDWLVEQVQKQIENGVLPAEIAIIAPKHKYLETITKFLLEKNIPVSYIRENSVLEEPTIVALLDMVKLTHFIITNPEQANVYWLKVLSNPCWNLSASTISKLSLITFYSRLSWQETLGLIEIGRTNIASNKLASEGKREQKSGVNNNALDYIASYTLEGISNDDVGGSANNILRNVIDDVLIAKPHLQLTETEVKQVSSISKFFIEISKTALQEPAEQILNRLLGVENVQIGAEEETDDEIELGLIENDNFDFNSTTQNLNQKKTQTFVSPFKQYYFDTARNNNDKNYLIFLANLRVLVDQLRKMNSAEQILISHWLESLAILNARQKPLVSKLSIGNSSQSVNLITAHSAKGLEFETVFLVHCNKSVWSSKGKNTILSLPKNLNLQSEAENRDDQIRLFFVSLTRAKRNLFLSYSNLSLQDEQLEKLTFLDESSLEEEVVEKEILPLNLHWFNLKSQENLLTLTETEFLAPELQGYQLSVTHLNNFLDIEKGGPNYFLSTNLLRFPMAKSESAVFGTLMHESMANFYKQFASTKTLPDFDYLLTSFKTLLNRQKISKNQKEKDFKKASRYLKDYYENRKDEFNFNHKIEFDFKNQGVLLGQAKLSGKIDKMVINEENKTISVIDLKTGKYIPKWVEKGTSYEAEKSDNYKRQLVFYKLLVENSREFKGKYIVDSGALDFLESDLDTGLVHCLETSISNHEAEQLELLIQKIWARIMKLDFSLPSQKYDKGLAGKQQFIQELLAE